MLKDIFTRIYIRLSNLITLIKFSAIGVKSETFTSIGVPLLDINSLAICRFGSSLTMVNTARHSTLGNNKRCKFVVYANASLIIGNKVGMSNVVLVATKSITIGNNVMIGGGTQIVDSDFHSLNPVHWHTFEDEKNMVSLPVVIGDHVFIGMNTIILKGVVVGNNVVIAAGSVVSKDIPDDQIWGGNPAKFIRHNKNIY